MTRTTSAEVRNDRRHTPTLEMPALANAACAEIDDPDRFFPDGGSAAHDAKRICRHCPERLPCLIWAIENHERGIWGGLTPEERHQLARRAA